MSGILGKSTGQSVFDFSTEYLFSLLGISIKSNVILENELAKRLVQKPFVEVIANIFKYPYKFSINWAYVIVAVLTTAILAVFYIIFSNKLKTGSVSTFGFGSLLCVSTFFSICIIPRVVGFIENYMFSRKIIAGGITEEIYGARATIAFIMSFVDGLSLTAIVLLLCAYSMYWFKVRNCLNTIK